MNKLLLSLAITLMPIFAWATNVYIHEVDASGNPALKGTIQSLVRSAVARESGYSVVASTDTAEIELKPTLIKLGNSYILDIEKTRGGKSVFSSKMKAAGEDNLDTVSARVVRAVLNEQDTRESAQLDEIIPDEVKRGTERYEATHHWRIGLGPAGGTDMNTNATGTHFLLGFAWGIDTNWDIDLNWRYSGFSKSGESGASFNDFAIGVNYAFQNGANSPYVGGGIGRGFASVSTEETGLFRFTTDRANGFSGHLTAGYRFFRTSKVNLAVEANYSKIFAQTTESASMPGVYDLAVVLFF